MSNPNPNPTLTPRRLSTASTLSTTSSLSTLSQTSTTSTITQEKAKAALHQTTNNTTTPTTSTTSTPSSPTKQKQNKMKHLYSKFEASRQAAKEKEKMRLEKERVGGGRHVEVLRDGDEVFVSSPVMAMAVR